MRRFTWRKKGHGHYHLVEATQRPSDETDAHCLGCGTTVTGRGWYDRDSPMPRYVTCKGALRVVEQVSRLRYGEPVVVQEDQGGDKR